MPRETMMAWDEARTAREADPTNKKLIEAEYAAEREHFDRVRDSQSWRRRALTILIIFAVAAAAWQIRETVVETQGNTAQVHALTIQNRALVTSLQSAIVESCEVNGNSRAKVQREQLREEIKEAEHPDPEAFHALVAAGVSAQAIRRSEAKAVVKYKARLTRVKIVPCASQYKISPGSGQRRRGLR